MARGVNLQRSSARLDILKEMEDDFLEGRGGPAASSHRTAYLRAVKMMRSAAVKAFDLAEEPAKLRDR